MARKIILVLFFCLISITGFAIDFPELTGNVVDEAHILSETTKQRILSLMKPNQQFVVVTLKSLRGYEIEDYSVALGRHWGIGSREKNDGLLLIVAPNEKRVRIEVGYGLEHVITDVQAKKIIQNIILPAFVGRDYDTGIWNGVVVLQQLVDGKQVSTSPPVPLIVGIFVIAFMFIFNGLSFSMLYAIYLEIKKRIDNLKNQPGVYKWKIFSFLVQCVFLLQVIVFVRALYLMVKNNYDLPPEMICCLCSSFLYGFILGKLSPPEKGRGRSASSGSSSSRSSFSSSHRSGGGGGSFGGGGASGRW